MKQAITRGLAVFADDDDISAGILTKALVARGCNWVDLRLGLKKLDEPNVRWGSYKYIFISPSYYQLFKEVMLKLEIKGNVIIALCSMNKTEFKKLKKEYGAQDNGASKVMYICTTLFSLCGDIQN